MRIFDPCPPCGRQGRPGQGFLAGSNTSEPRGSAPRERDHRGGDHPVPSRTRQLSPPSPRVLQREAAGGQGVALAEGAFLYAPIGRRPPTGRRPPLAGACARGGARAAQRREGPRGGDRPLRASLCFGRHRSARRRDRCRGPSTWPADCVGASHAPGSSDRGESSLWDFLRFEVEKRLLDVWLFSVRVLWSHAGSRFRLLPNCV